MIFTLPLVCLFVSAGSTSFPHPVLLAEGLSNCHEAGGCTNDGHVNTHRRKMEPDLLGGGNLLT